MRRFRTGSAVIAVVTALSAGWALADGSVVTLEGDAPLSTLVRFEERDYRITTESSVSLEPTREVRVRKIGYGAISEVNVVTTASGTYSSEGLASPHIQYPGISAQAEPSGALAARLGFGPATWTVAGGGSILSVHADPGAGFVIVDSDADGLASCHLSGSFTHCFLH